jgi:hypothetical protein
MRSVAVASSASPGPESANPPAPCPPAAARPALVDESDGLSRAISEESSVPCSCAPENCRLQGARVQIAELHAETGQAGLGCVAMRADPGSPFPSPGRRRRHRVPAQLAVAQVKRGLRDLHMVGKVIGLPVGIAQRHSPAQAVGWRGPAASARPVRLRFQPTVAAPAAAEHWQRSALGWQPRPRGVRSTVTGSPASASSAVACAIPATCASSLARAMLACPCTVTWYPCKAPAARSPPADSGPPAGIVTVASRAAARHLPEPKSPAPGSGQAAAPAPTPA